MLNGESTKFGGISEEDPQETLQRVSRERDKFKGIGRRRRVPRNNGENP